VPEIGADATMNQLYNALVTYPYIWKPAVNPSVGS
jgi:hypothetical protein